MTPRRTRSTATAILTVATASFLLPGCATHDTRVLTVHAAASLSAVMNELASEFEAEHPGTEIRVNTGGSTGLATQIIDGAPGDVYASADLAQMARVTDEGIAPEPRAFASNTLTIAVEPGNPANIGGLDALTDPDLDVVVCAQPVPCGEATARVEATSGIELMPVSEELSVTDVLAKVTSGQADAGLVYVTDVAASGGTATEVPLSNNTATSESDLAEAAQTVYAIATLTTSSEPELATQFVAYALSDPGQALMTQAGFGAAP
ncbi:molybdate ABC transporter substrate-binding protein [Demequina sediminicola]|uniref:molybdate ABC transporter substrate-binding protein n=1 Tax=Demequina sediminicola TaxID=1095026 RepID=UPI0007827507|nr:molybdate ABC transporter substrate-binding protein [Demequina sediminicola]